MLGESLRELVWPFLHDVKLLETVETVTKSFRPCQIVLVQSRGKRAGPRLHELAPAARGS